MWRKEPKKWYTQPNWNLLYFSKILKKKNDVVNIEFEMEQLGASQMSMLYIALIRNRSPQTNMHDFSKKKMVLLLQISQVKMS